MTKNTQKDMVAMMTAMLEQMEQFNERLTALETPKVSKRTSTSSSKKSAPKKSKSSTEFDRSLYEATAKKLGVLYKGQVCATVKDGKVIATRKENREKVYKAMGLR